MLGHVTMRSSSVAVLFISITEAPFRALEMGEKSAELKSIIGMVGKSNSIRKLSCDSGINYSFDQQFNAKRLTSK